MKFDEWFYGSEGYSLRCERFYEDILNMSSRPYKIQQEVMLKWLQAAYEVGAENEKTR
jgi:hypothetical protein